MHQFGPKMLLRILVGCVFHAWGRCTRYLFIADWEDFEHGESTSDVHLTQLKIHEYKYSQLQEATLSRVLSDLQNCQDVLLLGPAVFVNPQCTIPPRETSRQKRTPRETSRPKAKRIPTNMEDFLVFSGDHTDCHHVAPRSQCDVTPGRKRCQAV